MDIQEPNHAALGAQYLNQPTLSPNAWCSNNIYRMVWQRPPSRDDSFPNPTNTTIINPYFYYHVCFRFTKIVRSNEQAWKSRLTTKQQTSHDTITLTKRTFETRNTLHGSLAKRRNRKVPKTPTLKKVQPQALITRWMVSLIIMVHAPSFEMIQMVTTPTYNRNQDLND